MKNCKNCGKEAKPSDNFCSSCGSDLKALACPKCAKECEATDLFCTSCGNQLSAEVSSQNEVTENIFYQKSEWAHENSESYRKHVTILFADLKGSTELIQGLDPEEAKEVLMPTIQKMINAIYQFNGVVIHVLGDGLVSVFGAHQTLEDHAFRACLAALAIQSYIKAHQKHILIRIGLHSGEVLIEKKYSSFDVMGPNVHLAARMEQTAQPGTIQLTKDTLRLVKGEVEYTTLNPIQVKGFKELIEIYQLNAIKENIAQLKIEGQPVHSPFVGRKKEFNQLIKLLDEAKTGKGNAVSIIAEAGSGKSRLIYELIHSDQARGCEFIVTSGFSHTSNIPFLPVINLFKNLFQIGKNEMDEISIREKIKPFLKNIDAPFSFDACLALLNLTYTRKTWTTLEPGIKRKYMLETALKILQQHALQKTLIIIFEDLHWIDSESEDFLKLLIHNLQKSKLFLLMTYRDDYSTPWLQDGAHQKIILTNLKESAVKEIIESILGENPNLGEFKKLLLEKCDGNPFFLMEMIQALISEKILVGTRKHYQINLKVIANQIRMPETIYAILQMKMDKLPTFAKKTLQIASVIGISFTYSQLIKVMEIFDERELRETLNILTLGEYIFEKQIYPEPEFLFNHSLMHDVAYQSLLKNTRRTLHAKILSIYEASQQKTSRENEIQIMANHAYSGEVWDKAFLYCIKAAENAYACNAFKLCVQFYERALLAADNLQKTKEIRQKLINIYYELYYSLVPLGRFDEQEKYLKLALSMSIEEKDKFFESLINSSYAIHYLGHKDARQALQFAISGFELAQEIGSYDATMIAEFTLIHAYQFLGEYPKVIATNNKLQKSLTDINYRSPWLKAPIGHIANFYTCLAHFRIGDYLEIENILKSWLPTVDINIPSIPSLCVTSGMGLSCYLQKNYEQSLNFLKRALEYSLDTEVIILTPVFASLVGCLYLFQNKSEEGRKYINQAIDVTNLLHYGFTSVFALKNICEGLILLKEKEQAKTINTMALKLLTERNLNGEKSLLELTECEIEMQFSKPDYKKIRSQLEKLLRLFEQRHVTLQVAHCHLLLAALHEQLGNSKEQKLELNLAKQDFESLQLLDHPHQHD